MKKLGKNLGDFSITKLVMKKSQKIPCFFCEACQYTTSNKKDFQKHELTAKHKLRIFGHGNTTTPYQCDVCSKQYKSAHGLWYHKKKCVFIEKSPQHNAVISELVVQLLHKNDDLVNKIVEMANTPKVMTINNTTDNSRHNHKHFNLNVFLNQNCKNAMNIKEFVDSLNVESTELENVGKLGYVEGISNILLRGLRALDETERPMHCMDKKRETLYIKDGDVWNKDEKKGRLKQVISQIAHKNFLKINEWKTANPTWDRSDSKKHEEYIEMVKQVFTCITPDDDHGINKIIKRVANEIYVDKV